MWRIMRFRSVCIKTFQGSEKDDDDAFINENVRLPRLIIKKYRLRMLNQKLEKTKQKLEKTKQKLEKTEDDNLMLRDRNSLLKYQQTLLEDSWTRARFQCTDIRFEMGQALQAERGENASLVTEIRRLRQELVGFKTGAVLQAERDENATLVTDDSRLKQELEAVKRELDKKLHENPGLMCCLTLQCFQNPVYASDGNTYEKAALEQWITRNGTSPLTRRPISPPSTRFWCRPIRVQAKAQAG